SVMSQPLPAVYLARHGETAWTVTGQHTGLTDLPLTERGERNARRLGERLKGVTFAHVFTSPLQRAKRTCELAGFGAVAEVDPNLVEWNYGAYEARKRLTFARSGRTGSCSATAARVGRARRRLPPARTVSSPACGRWTGICCSFPVAISCAFSRHAGVGSTWRSDVT